MGELNSAVQLAAVALMIESVFYGMFLITFVACLQRLLLKKDSWKPSYDINLRLLAVVVVLFVLTSLNEALELYGVIQTFSHHIDGGQQDRHWDEILRYTLLTFQFLLADGIMIHRCWLVWNSSLVVVFTPLVFWTGVAVCGTSIFYIQVAIGPSDDLQFFGIAVLASTIVINVYSSGMILYKIWSVERGWTPPSICSMQHIPQRSRLQLAKRIVMDSGLLYTTTTIVFFLTEVCNSPVSHIACAAEIQIAGIAFNLIVMRTAETSANTTNPSNPSVTLPVSRQHSPSPPEIPIAPSPLLEH